MYQKKIECYYLHLEYNKKIMLFHRDYVFDLNNTRFNKYCHHYNMVVFV